MTMYGAYDGTNLTVIVDGRVYQSTEGDPNFEDIFSAFRANDEAGVVAAADATAGIRDAISRTLSDEVEVRYGRVFWRDVEISGVLSERILELVSNSEDTTPLVRFLEKIQRNPQAHSREQLFGWLQKNTQFTIDGQGEILAYKSVLRTDKDGVYRSIGSGTAYVNDVKQTGQIEQRVGDVVTMPREEVMHDPFTTCSTGLHAASKHYATTWTNHDALLILAINPRDVVSVPTDASGAKMRTCRYRVVGEVESTHQFDNSFYETEEGENWYDDEEYDDESEDDEGYGDEDDESTEPDEPFSQLRRPGWTVFGYTF